MFSKTTALAAAFLLCLSFIAAAGVIPQVHSSALTGASGYNLMSTQTFDQYGQFSVNETLTGTSNSTSLSSLTFGFPASFGSHLVLMNSSARLGGSSVQTSVTTHTSNDTLLVTLSFARSLGGQNSSATLSFWVLDSLQPINSSGYYTGVALASPSANMQFDSLNSSISFPHATTFVSNTTSLSKAGFGSATTIITVPYQGQIQDWLNFTRNVTPSLKTLAIPIFSLPVSTGSVEFTSISRQISIASNGQIVVTDTLNLRNLGPNTISSLDYTPLTTASTITALPSVDPPLSNVVPVSISSGQLSLNSTNQQIQPQSSASLIFQYSLPNQYWSVENGVYNVTIPTTPPVAAVVDQYRLFSTSVSGVIIDGKPILISESNVAPGGTASETLKFRVGIASASSSTLPLASILFVGVFLAGLIFRPRAEESSDVGSAFDNMIRTIEDKVSSTNDLLSELQSKGTGVTRNELAVVRSRIDEVRSKSTSRIAVIRSQLQPSISTAVQTGLNEVLANDRDFDRTVRDILNNYDQVASKRMKEETFTRVQQSNYRKLQSTTNSLMDRVHDLREEYESEG
jgi:hypothetical protein